MLEPEDMPEGWHLVGQLPADQEDAMERQAVGHTDDLIVNGVQHVEWHEIRNDDGTRAIIRIAPVEEDHFSLAVTAALVLSADSKSMLQRRTLANVPAVAISRAVNARWSTLTRSILNAYGGLLSSSLDPLPKFARTDEFYKAVAQHWRAAYYSGDPSPTDRIMDDAGVSKPTAQRWVAEARKRGFIPQGLTGKPGRR